MATFLSSTYTLTGAPMATSGQLQTVDSTQKLPACTVVQGTDAVGAFAEYIYLQGVASTIVGSVVTFDEAGVTTLLAASAIGPVAVALAIVDATTEWGWYGLTGTFPTDVVANCADNKYIGRETTDGKVGDGFATGDMIVGAMSRAATTTAAVVNCQFSRGFVTDQLGA